MKRLLLIASILMLAVGPLYSQADTTSYRPPSVQEVMDFFKVMHFHDQMQSMLDNERKQMNVMSDDMFTKALPNGTAEERAQFKKILNSTMDDVFKDFPIDDLLRDMVPVYQHHLSESDLNKIMAFYSSPVGQKVLREMPAMTAEAMRVSYMRLQPKIDEMMTNMKTRLQQMSQEEQNNKSAAPKTVSPDQQPQN